MCHKKSTVQFFSTHTMYSSELLKRVMHFHKVEQKCVSLLQISLQRVSVKQLWQLVNLWSIYDKNPSSAYFSLTVCHKVELMQTAPYSLEPWAGPCFHAQRRPRSLWQTQSFRQSEAAEPPQCIHAYELTTIPSDTPTLWSRPSCVPVTRWRSSGFAKMKA